MVFSFKFQSWMTTFPHNIVRIQNILDSVEEEAYSLFPKCRPLRRPCHLIRDRVRVTTSSSSSPVPLLPFSGRRWGEGKSSSTSAYASSTWLLCPGCKGEWWCCMQRQGGGGSSKNHPMFDNRHRSVNKSFIDDNLVNLFIRNVVKKVTPMTLYTIWHQISYLV